MTIVWCVAREVGAQRQMAQLKLAATGGGVAFRCGGGALRKVGRVSLFFRHYRNGHGGLLVLVRGVNFDTSTLIWRLSRMAHWGWVLARAGVGVRWVHGILTTREFRRNGWLWFRICRWAWSSS